ncbi:MAG: oligosaccharide repeat unit polymerase [Shewanella sp.]
MQDRESYLSYCSTTRYAFILYILFNVTCAIYFSSTGFLGGDFANQYISVKHDSNIIATMLVVFTLFFFLYFIYQFADKLKTKHIKYTHSFLLDLFTVIVLLFGLYVAWFYKIGVIGLEQEVSPAPAFYRQVAAIVQPIMFGLVYFYYRADFKNKWFLLNIFLYLPLILIGGQTGQILLLFFLWIYAGRLNNKKNAMKKAVFFTVIGLVIYPFIRLLKESIIASAITGDDFFVSYTNMIAKTDFYILYIKYFFITLERFQHVANIQYLLEQKNDIANTYQIAGGTLSDFFQNYWLIVFICKTFGIGVAQEFVSPQTYLALMINGKDTWASQVGIFGYFIFYGFFGFFVFLCSVALTFISGYLSNVIVNDKRITLLSWLMTLMIICHGWIFAYVYFIQTLIVFIFVLLVVNQIRILYPARRIGDH